MSEQMLLEYALNAAWQVPLVTAAAWLFLRAARLGPLGEHRVWLAVLAVCVFLPTRGIERMTGEQAAGPVATTVTAPAVGMDVTPPQTMELSEMGHPGVRAAAIEVPKRVEASIETMTAESPVESLRVASTAAPQSAPVWHVRVGMLRLSRRLVRAGAWIYASVMMIALLRLARGG